MLGSIYSVSVHTYLYYAVSNSFFSFDLLVVNKRLLRSLDHVSSIVCLDFLTLLEHVPLLNKLLPNDVGFFGGYPVLVVFY